MRKFLHKFEHSWQAEIVKNLLEDNGINSVNLMGSRDYVDIVTGMGQVPTEIHVEEECFQEAQKILTNYFNRPILKIVDGNSLNFEEKSPKDDFRKIAFLSVAAVFFLPLVFNVLATLKLQKYLKQDHPLKRKLFTVTIVGLGWLGSLFILYWGSYLLIQ
jgi:hypothetical protein